MVSFALVALDQRDSRRRANCLLQVVRLVCIVHLLVVVEHPSQLDGGEVGG
jgi:hypothetical protein